MVFFGWVTWSLLSSLTRRIAGPAPPFTKTCLQGVQRRVAFFSCFLELAFLSWALGDLLLKGKEIAGLKTPHRTWFAVFPPLPRHARELAFEWGWEGEHNVHEMIRCACMGQKRTTQRPKERKKKTKKGKKEICCYSSVESFKRCFFRWTGLARARTMHGHGGRGLFAV